MGKKIFNKVCKYCGDQFTTTRSNKEYCSQNHAKYQYEVRKGIRLNPKNPTTDKSYLELTEKDISDINSRIVSLEEIIQDLEIKIDEVDDSDYWNNDEKIRSMLDLLHKKLRAIEEKKVLIKSLIDPSIMKGADVKKYSESQFTYTFSEYATYDYFLETLGDQIQPFRSLIAGAKWSGKTILALKIANRLIDRLSANLLYVCSKDQEKIVLQYIQHFQSLNENFTLRILNSELQIRDELKKEHYEFLIIDQIDELISHSRFYHDMLIEYPRLSIFCTSNNSKIKGVHDFEIVFKTRLTTTEDQKHSTAEVWSQGKKLENLLYVFDMDFGIFSKDIELFTY